MGTSFSQSTQGHFIWKDIKYKTYDANVRIDCDKGCDLRESVFQTESQEIAKPNQPLTTGQNGRPVKIAVVTHN